MPTYEYRCKDCHHEFEREQRITDDPVKTCPSCRKRKVERLISQTSFVLKGSGWYSDLYSSTKPKKDEDKSEPASGGDADKKSKPKDDGGGSKKKKKGKGSKAAA